MKRRETTTAGRGEADPGLGFDEIRVGCRFVKRFIVDSVTDHSPMATRWQELARERLDSCVTEVDFVAFCDEVATPGNGRALAHYAAGRDAGGVGDRWARLW